MADKDLCRCGKTRADHDGGVTGMLARLGAACLTFELDRKATWAAERGQKQMRTVSVFKPGCRLCGRGDVPLRKTPEGRYYPEAHECKR